ncbi:putative SET-binding protein, partial [Triplophysa rosa]
MLDFSSSSRRYRNGFTWEKLRLRQIHKVPEAVEPKAITSLSDSTQSPLDRTLRSSMEQRDLNRTSRPKGNEEFFSTVTTINRADLSEVGLLASPMKSLPLPCEQQDRDKDEDLGLGKEVDATYNVGSERWAQGDGLDDQEFSIKEASFSEGSLKLKIQTTKRAKKPPKNLENYICPPEIRITIKQPGEQKAGKHGRSSRRGKEEDKGPPRKR